MHAWSLFSVIRLMPEGSRKMFGTFTLPFRISQHGHDPAPDSDTPGNKNWPALGE